MLAPMLGVGVAGASATTSISVQTGSICNSAEVVSRDLKSRAGRSVVAPKTWLVSTEVGTTISLGVAGECCTISALAV